MPNYIFYYFFVVYRHQNIFGVLTLQKYNQNFGKTRKKLTLSGDFFAPITNYLYKFAV